MAGIPDLSKLFNAGRDMALDFGSATSGGGGTSFGNLQGPSVGGRPSDWMTVAKSNTPLYVGGGLLLLAVIGGVIWAKKG